MINALRGIIPATLEDARSAAQAVVDEIERERRDATRGASALQVTDEMVQAFRELNPAARNIDAGLMAALAKLDVQLFTMAGQVDGSMFFIHLPCATVVDVMPGDETHRQMQQEDCDCENEGEWRRIYVGEAA